MRIIFCPSLRGPPVIVIKSPAFKAFAFQPELYQRDGGAPDSPSRHVARRVLHLEIQMGMGIDKFEFRYGSLECDQFVRLVLVAE